MSDRILGGVCVVAAAGMAWAAHDYAAAISYEPVGPRAFPLLLSVLMGIGGIWLVLKPTMRGGAVDFAHFRLIGSSALAVIVYCLLFQWLGFTLATALMAVPVGVAFGGNWWRSLLAGAGLGIGLFLLFDKLLDVVLPTGVLHFILGGR